MTDTKRRRLTAPESDATLLRCTYCRNEVRSCGAIYVICPCGKAGAGRDWRMEIVEVAR